MSRLRESLPTYLQRRFGICRRTFERWCTQGDVPGAYRTRGGHWRVRKPTRAMIKRAIRASKGSLLRERVRDAIVDYRFTQGRIPIEDCPMTTLSERAEILQKRGIRVLSLAEEEVALKVTLSAYGITDEDVRDIHLDQRDPEKDYILWEKPYDGLHPRAYEAVKKHRLGTAAYLVWHNRREITAGECRTAVARQLGISPSTLYRRYGAPAVRAACKEPPVSLSPSLQQEAEYYERKKTPNLIGDSKRD